MKQIFLHRYLTQPFHLVQLTVTIETKITLQLTWFKRRAGEGGYVTNFEITENLFNAPE